MSEITGAVEKQIELVGRHLEGESGGADTATLASAKAELDTAISKLMTIESLVRSN